MRLGCASAGAIGLTELSAIKRRLIDLTSDVFDDLYINRYLVVLGTLVLNSLSITPF